MDTVSEANGTFGIDLLKILCRENPTRNIVFSPLGISSALAMVLLGAKGQTADQIGWALSLSNTVDVHRDFQSLLRAVNKSNKQCFLRSASRLFGDSNVEFLSTFQQSCLQFYDAKLKQLPLQEERENSREQINAWIYKQTGGKIQKLLPHNAIDKHSKLVLANAMYFKGKWDNPFRGACTREKPFKINEYTQRPVPMMIKKATVKTAHVSEAEARVLELFYAGDELSMLVVLPDDGVELSAVEDVLTFENLTAWTRPDCMETATIDVFLPKFKVEEDYNMKSVLQQLGMRGAFEEYEADFSALSDASFLCLSHFAHKSVVEVTEDGTVTARLSGTGSSFDSVPAFCADHPFLFFIRHNPTNTLLFCGRFSSP